MDELFREHAGALPGVRCGVDVRRCFPGCSGVLRWQRHGAPFPDKLNFPFQLDDANRVCLSALQDKEGENNNRIGEGDFEKSGRKQNSGGVFGGCATDANKGCTSVDFRDQRVVWIKVYVNTMEADGDVHMFCLKAEAAPQKQRKL